MAFDEQLGIRIRDLLETRPDIDEQRMFGGIAFLDLDQVAVADQRDQAALGRLGRDVKIGRASCRERVSSPV